MPQALNSSGFDAAQEFTTFALLIQKYIFFSLFSLKATQRDHIFGGYENSICRLRAVVAAATLEAVQYRSVYNESQQKGKLEFTLHKNKQTPCRLLHFRNLV